MGPKENPYVPRVTQLDAVDLDKEILQVLKSQVINITKVNNVGFLAKWEPEIDAVLQLILWKFSVNTAYSTFGQQLLSMKYGGLYNKRKAYMLAILTIGSRYADHRSREIMKAAGSETFTNVMSDTLHWIRVCIRIANVVNLFVFLMQGKYPTLTDRLLKLRPVSLSTGIRIPGYKFMVREALWHGFMELLGVTLPLINFHYIRRKLVNLFSSQSSIKSQPAVFTATTKCGVCKENPIHPHGIGCVHVFCYYCVQANFLADREFRCPLCGISAKDSGAIVPLQLSITQDRNMDMKLKKRLAVWGFVIW
ncbi:peroxisome biogenesis factor 2 isoform X2 [Anabrus simplex]|uniref:peroxisome biogenesis factor 2 isoform X2 n=1 Tax=Anabrus simplex TaxID=316456 RepID=UPI0035A2620A